MKSSSRVDAMVNNMVATFNECIINARTKHIMSMLENIRTIVMHILVLEKGEVSK